MGRDREIFAHWKGQSAEVPAILESTEIILRGGIRDRVPRAAITGISVDQGDLRLLTEHRPLVLELGAVEAARWVAPLQKPVPTLAQKLGAHAGCLAFVNGSMENAELVQALQGCSTANLAEAGVLGGGAG